MSASPHYQVVQDVFEVDPDLIDMDETGQIGLIFPAWVEALSLFIDRDGQRDPVKLVKKGNAAEKPWRIVAGRHRVLACATLGRPVCALEVSGDEATLRDIQRSENGDRRELAPLERAMFVHAVAESAKARVLAAHGGKSQQQVASELAAAHRVDKMSSRSNLVQFGDLQKADERAAAAEENLSTAYSWKPETAEVCGLGQKDVQRSIRIYDCLIRDNRDLIDAFKDHPVAAKASDLLEICSIKEADKRRAVIETLIGGPKELGMVLTMLGIKQAPASAEPFDKFSQQIHSGFSRLGAENQRRFFSAWIGSHLTPGTRKMMREELERFETERGAA